MYYSSTQSTIIGYILIIIIIIVLIGCIISGFIYLIGWIFKSDSWMNAGESMFKWIITFGTGSTFALTRPRRYTYP
jgi:hypothetical protein